MPAHVSWYSGAYNRRGEGSASYQSSKGRDSNRNRHSRRVKPFFKSNMWPGSHFFWDLVSLTHIQHRCWILPTPPSSSLSRCLSNGLLLFWEAVTRSASRRSCSRVLWRSTTRLTVSGTSVVHDPRVCSEFHSLFFCFETSSKLHNILIHPLWRQNSQTRCTQRWLGRTVSSQLVFLFPSVCLLGDPDTSPPGVLRSSVTLCTHYILMPLLCFAGSSTACIVVLDRRSHRLHTCNLGDSGFLVVRGGEVVHRSDEQQHYFNTPFQLSIAPPGAEGVVLSDRSADPSCMLHTSEGCSNLNF